MADIEYCEACAELGETAPNVVVNGITDTECGNLQENKGLSGESDDCTDLNLLNDCLIGEKVDEVDTQEVCDWRDFTKGVLENLWNVLKAIICAICGLWNAVTELESKVDSYHLTEEDGNVTLVGPDDVSHGTFENSRYQLHTKTYTSSQVSISAGDSRTFTINTPQPSGYADTLVPMAVAGWEIEGTGVTQIAMRYIQLVDRAGTPKVKAVFQNMGNSSASVTFKPEVLWWGRKTD